MTNITDQLYRFRYIFYAVDRETTTFQTTTDVPDYVALARPHLLCLIVVEALVLQWKYSNLRLNDFINCICHALLYTLARAITRGVEFIGYQWLYDRRILDMNWDSPYAWWIGFFGVDFGYYWIHRCVHELAIGWAVHQVHHSSEDFTLGVGIRQSVFQNIFSLGFYLPCALLGVPIPILLVHLQFNTLYQVWIHTQLVSNLGPLEWVFNTPSHHRVHHGSDPWCLDKNYGGVLIIWDKLFGTFEPERKGVNITYGIVEQPQSMNVLYQQIFYINDIFKKASSMESWSDYFKTIVYPPAWMQGCPREYKPPFGYEYMPTRVKYNPRLPRQLEAYLVVHLLLSMLIQQQLLSNFQNTSWVAILLHMFYFLVTLGNIGAFYDSWSGALMLEGVRCVVFSLFSYNVPIFTSSGLNFFFTAYSGLSAGVWLCHAIAVNFMKTKKLT